MDEQNTHRFKMLTSLRMELRKFKEENERLRKIIQYYADKCGVTLDLSDPNVEGFRDALEK